jgi:hypothetical protein
MDLCYSPWIELAQDQNVNIFMVMMYIILDPIDMFHHLVSAWLLLVCKPENQL